MSKEEMTVKFLLSGTSLKQNKFAKMAKEMRMHAKLVGDTNWINHLDLYGVQPPPSSHQGDENASE